MFMFDGGLVLGMLFFFVLPMTDPRTARMKLSVVSSPALLLAASAFVPHLMR